MCMTSLREAWYYVYADNHNERKQLQLDLWIRRRLGHILLALPWDA